MRLNEQIVEFLKATPKQTANQIAEKVGGNPKSVKVLLHRLQKQNKVVRVKQPKEQKTSAGPQNVYVYEIAAV